MTKWIISGEDMTAQVAAQSEIAAIAAMLHQSTSRSVHPAPEGYPVTALGRGDTAQSDDSGSVSGRATPPALT
jgi:hypothetical protein